MCSTAVIGAGGFIGANLLQHLKTLQSKVVPIYRNTHLDSISDQYFDRVFFCAGNSKTYLTKQLPLHCLKESISDLYTYLSKLRYGKFILISSVIVYPQQLKLKCEHSKISLDDLTLYGAHKLLAEHYVKQFAASWLVIRPTGFLGDGLKKNLLFDLKNNRKDIYLTIDSQIDYIPIAYFCEAAIALARKADNEIVNVGSGWPIRVDTLLRMKPGHYVFHEERFHDDRQLALEKLQQFFPARIPQLELFRQIENFISTN